MSTEQTERDALRQELNSPGVSSHKDQWGIIDFIIARERELVEKLSTEWESQYLDAIFRGGEREQSLIKERDHLQQQLDAALRVLNEDGQYHKTDCCKPDGTCDCIEKLLATQPERKGGDEK